MRITSTTMKVMMVIGLVAISLFAFGGVAFATSPPQNGPTPPALGDPVGGNISPHGGYSSSTNYCYQCHSMHNAGEYALLAQNSVTATCRTCHTIFGSGGGNARNSNAIVGATLQMGTAATRTAYDTTTGVAEHSLGENNSPAPDNVVMTGSDWAYRSFPNRAWNLTTGTGGPPSTVAAGPGTASDIDGGLYCGSCHTPHGNFGQLINSRVYRSQADEGSSSGLLTDVDVWQNNAPIYQYIGTSPAIRYLWNDVDPTVTDPEPTLWLRCTVTNPVVNTAAIDGAAGECEPLTKTNRSGTATDDLGQSNIYLYGYKLLSAYPNHNYGMPESWGVGYRDTDAARWCGACHASKVSDHMGLPFTQNNHPTACGYCHGVPSDQTVVSRDYPHTSTQANFLIAYPDGLCIGACHTAGSLP